MIYLSSSFKLVVSRLNTASFCDKEVVAQSKVLETKQESPQTLSNWLARILLIKFSIQYLENLDNKISNPLVVVFRNK